MKGLLARHPPSRVRIIVAALLVPAAAVGIARALGSDNLAVATALCLLAAVAAAAVAGRGSGIVASVVSFLGLNFFFTEPRHTLIVSEAGDLIALVAFLVAALIVGTLLSSVLEERARSERRATEAHFVSQTTERLISGEPFERILDGFAGSLVRLFALASCEISTPNGTGASSSDAGRTGEGPSVTIPIATHSGSFGSLTATRGAGTQEFSASDVELLKTLASQTALAIERAALDEEVRGARFEAEANRLRAALFSSVTHDLRTPLASIKASASGLLAKGARYSEAQREEMLRTVLEEADHLNQIVGNLLDLARMRAGALVPSRQPILIEDVVGSVLRRLRRAMEGFTVRTNIRPDLPMVDADPIQIEQVLSNIVENAVRFSPRGAEIQISVARWREGVQVRVTDQGPGIAPDDRTRVFEEFYRRDAGAGRGGTGLGLAIARAIVLAHGGTIWAEAAPGGGTAILFELPITKAPVGEAAPESREGVAP
jgi:two-component system sensor histidine kinase KdpD